MLKCHRAFLADRGWWRRGAQLVVTSPTTVGGYSVEWIGRPVFVPDGW